MNVEAVSQESFNRAVSGQSVMNYAPIILGFVEKGIPEADILPRENVFTFWAWQAVGRRVRKGEHGVKATTFVSVKGKADAENTDAKGYRMARAVTVFHVSQTEPMDTKPEESTPVSSFKAIEPAPIKADSGIARKFESMANALQAKIDYATRPMSQNPTPKRNRDYQSRMLDGRNMERTQRALRALAESHRAGDVPALLADLRTKDEIAELVRHHATGQGGYYSVIESLDYTVQTPQARLLQELSDVPSAQRAERERIRQIEALEAEIKLSNIAGYFPTPSAVVSLMLDRADLAPGLRVLEPSAGNGNIADEVRKSEPSCTVEVAEVAYSLRQVLNLKGYELVADDFMQVSASEVGTYDRIVMNPPFERQQDIDHVRHAWSLLSDGGILVSVMAPGFEFRNDRKSSEFREWLSGVGAEWEELPEGSFKESGTGVGTRLVTINK